MAKNTVIKVENLGKKYTIGEKQKYLSLRDSLAGIVTKPINFLSGKREEPNEFWALKDVNFEIKQGEVVGVIGKNGAGKSTLLKILSRITEPTRGKVTLNGRIASMLEVGTGFHQELTGRENIYLNGSILGMTRKEINRKFDDIVDFSGISEFIDTPVKRYSSGMYVRLAFAVAAHLEPEILLVDEVLAVGDAEFQKRSLGKMNEITEKEGRTVLFVSHNMTAIQSICNRCIQLEEGTIDNIGETGEVITKYLEDYDELRDKTKLENRKDRKGKNEIVITDIKILDSTSRLPLKEMQSGQGIIFQIDYENKSNQNIKIKSLNIGLSVDNASGQFITPLNSVMADNKFHNISSSGSLFCEIKKMPLMYGDFSLTATLIVNGELQDKIFNAFGFKILEGDFFKTGVTNAFGRQGVYIEQNWSNKNK